MSKVLSGEAIVDVDFMPVFFPIVPALFLSVSMQQPTVPGVCGAAC